jgi:hypothetical protein
MDRLRAMERFVVSIIMLMLLSACSKKNNIMFVYLDELLVMDNISEQTFVELYSFLYLDQEIIKRIDQVYPEFLEIRKKNIDDFVIHDADKLSIGLEKKYSSIENFVKNIDQNVLAVLADSLGIIDAKEHLQSRVFVYKNSAFVEFVQPSGVHALTFELKKPNQLQIGIAYIIVE